MAEMQREDMLKRLRDLDEEASLIFDEAERLHVVIVGGGALILLEMIPRMTHDIDALDVSNKLQDLMERYDINSRVKTYINNFPYNYEDRLVPITEIKGRIIDYFTASLEDIVIAKLYAGRDTDIRDVTDPNVLKAIDWTLLHELATVEAEMSALNEVRYREFLNAYEDYERRYRPCDN